MFLSQNSIEIFLIALRQEVEQYIVGVVKLEGEDKL